MMRFALFAVAVLLITIGCSKQNESQKQAVKKPAADTAPAKATREPKAALQLPAYSLLDDEVYDAPIKTQVTEHYLVTGEITAEGLERLLRQRYSEVMSRRGFEHHPSPTSAYLYAYLTEDHFKSGMGQWVAMIGKAHAEVNPKFSLNEGQLANMNAEHEERFGLSEEQRMQVWQELIRAEDNGLEEATAKYPNPNDWEKQLDLERSLTAKYKQQVLDKYGLTEDQGYSIVGEGVKNNWPMPAR